MAFDRKTLLALGITCGIIVVIVISAFCFVCCRWRKQANEALHQATFRSIESRVHQRAIELAELEEATLQVR